MNFIKSEPALPDTAAAVSRAPRAWTEGLTVVFTLVLWSTILCVGVAGLELPYARPHPPEKIAEPVQMQIMNAELSDESAPHAPEPQIAPDPLQPAPPPDAIIPPDAPPLLPVAQPDAVAFALPVEGPTRVVEPKKASHERPLPQPAAPTAVRQLVAGRGEGSQIHPEYPHEALERREEGAVGIEFTVAANGQIAAQATSPSRWPLLNQAALRAVRGAHLQPGPYRITINFQIR